ncbi:MAG TPA: VWA domain-containing protein [Candidatus Borkfalkia faecipullorum]|uniref:VWA domain-containing protein n=1 Tax=Candidatus Borkfalkia faecipullorum TaxID=2838510 RepID=A0A9D2AFK6_9FIRM|nr:VWA domain-containing protein [Candidatus Borkfalkia faecipullorum]
MSNQFLGEDDLVLNTASRIPVCLCLDVSSSMMGCIGELNSGVNEFYRAVRSNEAARQSCEIAVVTFGSDVKVVEDYSSVDTKEPAAMQAYGGTAMTEGTEKALEILEKRKEQYKQNGIDYYQPWLVIMSDGEPNDPATLKKVQEKIRQLEADRKLVVFAIGIGSGVNMDIMDNFSKRKAKKLKGYKFEDFFEWLGKSVSIVSQSQVGEKVKLDTSGMDDWAEI